MIRQVVALPFVYALSRIVGVVGWVGSLFKPSTVVAHLFDWLIGIENAGQMRDEMAESLVEAVASHDVEYDVSKQVMIEQIRENHRESIDRLSRGESVLSITIALIAVLVRDLPTQIQTPMGFAVPLPSVNRILLALSVLLVVSVSFRQLAIEAQAFSSPTVFDSYDELMMKLAWNGGTLAKSRVGFNTLGLIVLRQMDEGFYQVWLDFLGVFVANNGMSKKEGVRWLWPRTVDVVEEKFDVDIPGG